ncbi:MAG: NAD(P)-dependent oxidoreductase [Terracidiphilus sp.]|jgi:nucleoside-diphosphate-sugar epimerase
MAQIFVAGATGNIGQPVVAELLRRNFAVVAMVREPKEIPGCRTVVADLEGVGGLARQIAECDHIVHLASPRSDQRESVIIDDVLGTGRLMDLWERGNFVYMSSTTVYGVPRHAPLTESEPFDVTTWYDLGKVANEYQLRMMAGRGQRAAGVCLRPALMYGSGPRSNDRQLLALVYEKCERGCTFVFASEENLESCGCSFIGDEDLARATVDAIALKQSGAFHVESGFATWRTLIDTINEHASTKAAYVIRMDGDIAANEYRLPQSRTQLDTSAFTSQTGFQPKQKLDEIVDRFVASKRKG